MDRHTGPMQTDSRFLTVGDAARRSPYSVDRIRQAVRNGELPAERTPSGQYIIATGDLARWIAGSPRGAAVEAQRT